jgi:hypothetical protein
LEEDNRILVYLRCPYFTRYCFMAKALPSLLLVVLVLSSVACRRTGDEVTPVPPKAPAPPAPPVYTGPPTLVGEWLLVRSGGGDLTGKMDSLGPKLVNKLVFLADSTYARYFNGRLMDKASFQFRTHPEAGGTRAIQWLILQTYNTPSGKPEYSSCPVTLFESNKLNFTSGSIGGRYEYIRTKAPGDAVITP